MKKLFFIAFSIIVIFMTLMIFAYFNFKLLPTHTRYVHSIGANISLAPLEVFHIDFSVVKPQLQMNDFGIKNLSNESPYYRHFFIFSPLNETPVLYIGINLLSDNLSDPNNVAFMDVSYEACYPENQLESRIATVKSQLYRVAKICNLTINIENIEWWITYQEDVD